VKGIAHEKKVNGKVLRCRGKAEAWAGKTWPLSDRHGLTMLIHFYIASFLPSKERSEGVE
jgi:hypothetical protein